MAKCKDVKYQQNFGVLNFLTLFFICCKVFEIGNIANWSWWLVLTPLWIQLGLIALVLVFAIIVVVINK